MTVADDVVQQFAQARPQLIGVAYRLTGSVADAEDAVQDAWLRLAALPDSARADIRDLPAWLTTVVGRICLDRLRSAAVRRERYVGSWLPEPLVEPLPGQPGEDPLDAVARADGVRMAAMVVLDRLTPEQRVAFVLHDAFSLPFGEIAEALGCSPDAARQHASRARKAVADADPPTRVPLAEQRELVDRLVAALVGGDVPAVVALLPPDVVLVGDGGGRARTARQLMVGPDKVARFLVGLVRQYGAGALSGMRYALVNGDLGMVVPEPMPTDHGLLDPRATTFAVRDGLLVAVYDVANPDKLGHLPGALADKSTG